MKRLLTVAALTITLVCQGAETVRLSSLELTKMRQGWGKVQLNRSMREKPLSIGGKTYEHGVGTHATSKFRFDLAGGSERFLASVGVDDAADGNGKASVTFTVVGDGKKLFESGVMHEGDPAKQIDIDLKGVQALVLVVGDAGDGVTCDHADWAEARFIVTGSKPVPGGAPKEPAFILTPKPARTPRINGAKVFGVRPGSPFLFAIPATGERPMRYEVKKLPKGLKVNPESGIITGTLTKRGEYQVTFKVANAFGKAERPFKIVCGDTLALTPPMGWNHWYAHYNRVTDKMMREAADIMVSSGMKDVGYTYVDIDDCWMNAEKQKDPMRIGPFRDKDGNIIPNKHFPDMKGLTDYIHSKGLKAGTYTSPGPLTCAGFAGAWQHEAQDAKQFADWGFDFLKYDWCSYGRLVKKEMESGNKLEIMKRPYVLMGSLLKQQNRDIVFNLCQYGMGDVWKWGGEVGGHCWRTAGDLGVELDRMFEVALKNAEHREYSKPGNWNDPDYIQIGYIGSAFGGGFPEPCPFTPNEQYAFMSLWSLMAAPLFYSGDMTKLDEFTLNVLCNPEVIEVDQDPLGQSARVIRQTEDTFVMVKDLEDGSKAVGLCNRSEWDAAKVTAKWSDVGVKGNQIVRDVWRQKDLGSYKEAFEASVPRHGVVLVRIRPGR